MRLLFKQRMFSWFDSYDIYDEAGNTVYTVKGQLSWGHCLKIFDSRGKEVGTVKERVFTFLHPKFDVYIGENSENYVGCISKRFTFFKPAFDIDFCGWTVEGDDFFGFDYTITDADGRTVAYLSKQLFKWTDTYVIDITEFGDPLTVLMFALAMDAEKCSS